MAQLIEIDGKLINLDRVDTVELENGRTRLWFSSGACHDFAGDYRGAILSAAHGTSVRREEGA
jgi:hypothetical protein